MSATDDHNPWTDNDGNEKPRPQPITPIAASAADVAEFDPLVQQSHDAWHDQEGHPPPPPGKDAHTGDGPERPPASPQPQSAPATSISFPGLSKLVQTFAAIPRSVTPQPRSASSSNAVVASPVQAQSPSVLKDAPFDFQRFLDQMKLRSAEPVAKYLRSFLSNFTKKTFTVNDQVKLIHNFLGFISERMRECDPWRTASDVEFDNAVEAMEKLVMNRLYDYTFTPQIRRTGRVVTTDDLERDQVLAQRMRLFAWVNEDHLDIPSGEHVQGFLNFAEQELIKVNHYKAPRDKLICILNSCKVIFGLIRHAHVDEGADSFIPILIFVVLRARPENLISNVEYVNRFRSASKLQSEAGYYLSSLMGAISFIETMDHTSLSNITQDEFEKNVETAIQELPSLPEPSMEIREIPVQESPMAGEESARPLLLPTPTTIAEDTKRFIQRTGDLAQAAQQTISKPLNAIGRIFNEVLDTAEERLRTASPPWSPDSPQRPEHMSQGSVSQQPQYIATTYEPYSRPSPSPTRMPVQLPPPPPPPATTRPLAMGISQPTSRPASGYGGPGAPPRVQTPALDFSALSHEIERIDRAHQAARNAALDTLLQIFPSAEREVAEMVLEVNDGDLGRSIEALLEMTGGAMASPPIQSSH